MAQEKKIIPSHINLPIDRESELLQNLETHYKQNMCVLNYYRNGTLHKGEDLYMLHHCVTGFLQSVTKSLESIKSIETSYLCKNKQPSNRIVLLKIKLMILIAKIHVVISTMNSGNNTTSLNALSQVMEEFSKQKTPINIKNNIPAQEEISYALVMIGRHGSRNELKGYDVNRYGEYGYHYIIQYNNGIPKLLAYRDIFNTNGSSTYLLECTNTFEAIDKAYSPKLNNQELTTAEKIEYLTALTWAYELSIKSHPTIKSTKLSAYNENNKVKNITNAHPAMKYYNVMNDKKKSYFPKIQSLMQQIQVEELLENITSIYDYHRFLTDFYLFFQTQITDAVSLSSYLSDNKEVFACAVELRGWFVDFHEKNTNIYRAINEKFERVTYFKHPETKINFVNETCVNREAFNTFENPKATCQNTNESSKAQDEKVKEEVKQLPSEIQQIHKKTHNKKRTPAQTSNKNTPQTQSNNKPNTNTPTPKSKKQTLNNKASKIQNNHETTTETNIASIYLKKGISAVLKKKYQKAMHCFKISYFEAKENNTKLAALDGSIFSFQEIVLVELNKINAAYDFSPKNIASTDKIISDAKTNLSNINKQFSTYQSLAPTSKIEKTETTTNDIQFGTGILEERLKQITIKIDALENTRAKKTAKKTNLKPVHKKETKNVTNSNTTAINTMHFPSLLETIPTPMNNTPMVETPCTLPSNNPLIIDESTFSTNHYVPKYKYIVLTNELHQTFNFLHQVEGQHYLVGSYLLSILLGNNSEITINPSDMDFLSQNSISKEWIKNGHFRQTTEERKLFKLNKWSEFKPKLPLEVWLDEPGRTLLDSLLTRDFTISALACDKFGNVIDPTGLGLDDLQMKYIRMVDDAKIRIEKSPLIMLRAIKYGMQRFTLDKNIIDAILDWQPNNETNFTQLYALAEKIFYSDDKNTFVEQLKTYKLLSKIFNIADDTNTEEAISLLELKLKTTSIKSSFSYQNNFFVNTQKQAQELELKSLALQIFKLSNTGIEQKQLDVGSNSSNQKTYTLTQLQMDTLLANIKNEAEFNCIIKMLQAMHDEELEQPCNTQGITPTG